MNIICSSSFEITQLTIKQSSEIKNQCTDIFSMVIVK